MKTIIYDPHLNPITILDLSHESLYRLERGDRIRVAAPVDMDFLTLENANNQTAKITYVELYSYSIPIRMSECSHRFFIICDDVKNCSKLTPSFLDSQIKNVDSYQYEKIRKNYFYDEK